MSDIKDARHCSPAYLLFLQNTLLDIGAQIEVMFWYADNLTHEKPGPEQIQHRQILPQDKAPLDNRGIFQGSLENPYYDKPN